jgi:hypothetical protein
VKLFRPPEEKNSAEEQLMRIREQDLQGHIKSTKENDVKSKENGTKPKEINAKPEAPLKEKQEDPLAQDNQLKHAIDILKSWDILKRTVKG